MPWILRTLGLADATAVERRATFWTAAMFGAALAATFVLRPLRDQFGVDQGVARMPWLYGLTLLTTALFVPGFWWLANRMPSRRFVPIALQVAALTLVLLFLGLLLVPDYDWRAPGARWIGEAFWGYFSTLNVALPSLVWIHAVEHFRREQGLRLFGLVAVGGTLGAVLGSAAAQGLVALALPPSAAAVAALVLLQLSFLCYRRSLPACAAMAAAGAAGADAAAPAPGRFAAGGVLQGLRLLVRDPHLLAIAGYMALLGMVATAFYAAQTELVGRHVATPSAQAGWLAHTEFLGQTLVLTVQLFFTGRLLRRIPPAFFLCLLPVLSIAGLGALWLWSTVSAVAVVQILRRGARFSLEKPSREVLYTPLDLATKHKVKILLDTFAYRAGDLLGAFLQVLLRGAGADTGGAMSATIALALCWATLGFLLGRRSQPRPAAVPVVD